jgi:hypothetical protein
MKSIWKSHLSRETKLRLFRATAETILLYGCTTWSLTKQEERALDGTYTRMLRMVLNLHWSLHTSNHDLYGSLDKISRVIRARRLSLAGHVHRDRTSPSQHLLTWQPKHGKTTRGRQTTTFVDSLLRDTGLDPVPELRSCMADKDIWHLFSSRRPPREDVDRK